MFCYTSQLKIEKISAYKFVAKFPEQRVKVSVAKFMEAFVQILLFAEVCQRSYAPINLNPHPPHLGEVWGISLGIEKNVIMPHIHGPCFLSKPQVK